MFGSNLAQRPSFVVECKGCRKNVPAGVKDPPWESIVVACPLCEAKFQYRPSEVSYGRLSAEALKNARTV